MERIGTYIAALPESRAARARLLHALVLKRFPRVVLSFDYRMPTYRMGAHFLAWASQKQYLSVYTCSAVRIAGFRQRRPEVKCGVGCINFREHDTFNAADLRVLIRDALAPSKALLAREQAARASATRSIS